MTAQRSDMRQGRYSNTVDLCTAVAQVLRARKLVKALDTRGVSQSEQIELRLKCSSADLSSSYRWVPTQEKPTAA